MGGIPSRIVVDTNFLFMAIYNKEGKARRVLDLTIEKKIALFAPDNVKKELIIILKRELLFSDEEIKDAFEILPVNWVDGEIYKSFLEKTTVKKEADKTVEAVALMLDCGILTADTDFDKVKQRIDIDDLLNKLEEK